MQVKIIESDIHNEKLDFRAWYFRQRGSKNGRGASRVHILRKERLKRHRRLVLYRVTVAQTITKEEQAEILKNFIESHPKICNHHS
jgi:hypothetical protein